MIIVMTLLLLVVMPSPALACSSDLFEIVANGKKLFHGKGVCFKCHGTNGDGKYDPDEMVDKLNPRPTDLTRQENLKYDSDTGRYSAIRNGIKGTGMPAFRGILHDHEIRLIIEYLEFIKDGRC